MDKIMRQRKPDLKRAVEASLAGDVATRWLALAKHRPLRGGDDPPRDERVFPFLRHSISGVSCCVPALAGA